MLPPIIEVNGKVLIVSQNLLGLTEIERINQDGDFGDSIGSWEQPHMRVFRPALIFYFGNPSRAGTEDLYFSKGSSFYGSHMEMFASGVVAGLVNDHLVDSVNANKTNSCHSYFSRFSKFFKRILDCYGSQ